MQRARGVAMIKVAIVGGTGYTGVELLRLLEGHPQAEVRTITSRKEAGMGVAEMFPSLRGLKRFGNLAYEEPASARLADCNVVFFATPHGVAMAQARELVAAGVSGAGRKAELGLTFSEASDNFKAYNVAGHRHHPEIVQGLKGVTHEPVNVVFTPHLTPMIRGIHATLYARLTKSGVDLQRLYEERFAHEPFVDVMPPASHPDTRSVRASNVCRIAVLRPNEGDIVVVLSVIDNLVKGAAGQAVQNMNLLFGL